LVRLLRLEPALRQHVADRACDGFEFVAVGRRTNRNDLIERQVPLVQSVVAPGERDLTAIEAIEKILSRHESASFHRIIVIVAWSLACNSSRQFM
jgi:hypothetical protein